MFNGCSKLTSIPQLDTSNVASYMNWMFAGCTSLTSIPELDTSNVTDMGYMFADCSSLTIIPQLNTSKVTDMNTMFINCTSLPSTFPWTIDCSSISDIYCMNNMFLDSSVTNVTLYNVNDSIKSQVTSQLLKGDNTLTINFV
jgi:surface protein